MTDQEKTELKISILKDIRQCCHFNFAAFCCHGTDNRYKWIR